MKLLVIATVIGAALSANPPDLQGMWFTRQSTGTLPPNIVSGSWPATANAYDSIYAISGFSNMTYRYDHHTAVWSKLIATPNGLSYRAADMVYVGGNLVLFGGKSINGFDNTLYTLNVNNPTAWTPRINEGATPPPRNGHTFTLINGVVYLIGGWNEQQYFNGVWASDISVMLDVGAPVSKWIQVIPETTGPTLFHPRNGHSVSVYENRMYLFGGFWHNVAAAGPYTQCLPAAECTFYQDIWMWTPPTGVPTANSPNTWALIQPSTVIQPPARYGHAAAMIEDGVLCVYGGHGEGGAILDDLWTFLEHREAWVALKPTGTSPPALTTPVGANLGRHFIVYGGGATVYDYTPYMFNPADWVAPTAAPVVPVDDCVHHKDVQGINAGIVIAILIGIAQLVFGILVWRHTGAGFSCAAGGKGASPYAAMSS